MKILQVNTVIKGGSVGRIMGDLYEVIEKSGNEALVGVGRAPMPEAYKGILIGNKSDFYQHVLMNFFKGESGFGSVQTTRKFLAWIGEQKPDLIHLHNIHGFYLQVELLFEYIKKHHIPVVWTLHDCWSFTGHCAYYDFAACTKWQTGCENCVQHAKVYPYALFKDNSVASYARKRKAFCGVENLTLVTPSRWLSEQLSHSFLREYPVKVIYNGIDLQIFSPGESVDRKTEGGHKTEGRRKIEARRKTVLGVANIWEFRKGLNTFERLCEDLGDDYIVKMIGVSKKQKKQLEKNHPGKMIAIERTQNIEELAEAYRSADVYVNATLEDNFPTTNIEALACGTPVVTYATGGSGEAVTPESGEVVRRLDYERLLTAVREAANGKYKRSDCRAAACAYDKNERYQEYLRLYEEKLGI